MLYSRFSDNLLVRLIGTWETKEGMGSQLHAASGLAYFISPPTSITEALSDPIHTVVYLVFMTTACALFSKTWIEVSGSAPRDVAKQLKGKDLDDFSTWNMIADITCRTRSRYGRSP